MSDELLGLLDRVVGQAKAGEGIEAYGLDETETTVKAHDGDVESLSSARRRGIGVRVVRDQRVGYCFTVDLSEEALDAALAEARANATVGSPDPGNVLAEPRRVAELDGPLYDPAVEEVAPQDKVDTAIALDRATRGGGPDITGTDAARYGDSVRTAAICSSTGVRASYRRSDAYLLVEALAGRNGSTTSAYGLSLGRSLAELDIDAAAAEAVERATRLLGGRTPSSARVPIVFDPFVTASVLGIVAGGLTAEAVQRGRSLFAGKVGEQLAPAFVRLIDDGRLTGGPAAAPWDGEGTPTQRTVLLDYGVLQGYLHHVASAARDDAVSTGNASRGSYATPPGLSPTNFYVEPGDTPPADLIAGVDTGFYCQQVMGLHSGANPISGDFSVGAAGVMIRDGEFAEAVREATIAGSIPQMLAGIAVVGSDLRFLPSGGAMGGTTLLVDGMTLAGGAPQEDTA
ncbi:MAG: TldD/PmbA family protein [Actinobacteria bacterium]|nr:TldD/PmbA family protein [Actinomycetota bacterium]